LQFSPFCPSHKSGATCQIFISPVSYSPSPCGSVPLVQIFHVSAINKPSHHSQREIPFISLQLIKNTISFSLSTFHRSKTKICKKLQEHSSRTQTLTVSKLPIPDQNFTDSYQSLPIPQNTSSIHATRFNNCNVFVVVLRDSLENHHHRTLGLCNSSTNSPPK
jgi:hypothetical protein